MKNPNSTPQRRPVRTFLIIGLAAAVAACGGDYSRQVSKVTSKTRYLNPNLATQKIQGIESASIDNRGILTMKLSQRLYAPEYEAPVVQKHQVTGKRSNLVGTTLAAALTVGLYPLLAPKQFFKETFGHETSDSVLSEEPDRAQAAPTGRYEWTNLPLKEATIEISGLGKVQSHSVTPDEQGIVNLDLSRDLFNRVVAADKSLVLNLNCKSCTTNSQGAGPALKAAVDFTAPPGWLLVADYKNGRDMTWIAENGLVGNPANRPSTGKQRSTQWKEITQAAQKRSESKLQRMAELPESLQQESRQIEASKPPPEFTIVRDEFESTAAFNERARAARAANDARVAEYNRKVDQLNRKIRDFQNSVPRTLPRPLLLQTLTETMTDLVGDPAVKKIAYDADLQRFIVVVAGANQIDGTPVSFTMVTRSDIDANRARQLKRELTSARPFLRLAVTDRSIRPVSGHLLLGDQILAMDFVDSVDLPPLDTVRVESSQLSNVRPLKRMETGGSMTTPTLVLSEDEESRKLRERLEQLREQIRLREQVSSEKESIQNDIRQLESRLKQIGQGDFQDDLADLIKRVPVAATTGSTYAVVIGIADYDTLPRVTFADRSASSFAELVRRQYGIPQERMAVLLNSEATGVRMMARIKQSIQRLGPNDRLLVYYAGHTVPSKDGKNSILVPRDASDGALEDPTFQLSTLYQTLLASNAQQVVVVLDTCFSGRTDTNDLLFRDVAPVFPVSRTGLTPPSNSKLTVLTAGGPTDFANALKPRGHRLFSYHLLREMLASGGLQPDRFQAVSDAVLKDAVALGTDYRQQPMWLGKKDNLKP